MFAVEYTKSAIKQLQKLDHTTKGMIYGWIDRNLAGCSNPRRLGKALTGDKKGYWRYRIGTYRLIADIQEDTIKILIVNVAHRRDIYQ